MALSTAEALELFDTAMIVDEPFMLPARIGLTALRACGGGCRPCSPA
ncbi:hypothetical protein [Mycobacterium tuberculosis]